MNVLPYGLTPLPGPAFFRLPSSFPSSVAYWLFETHWLYAAGLVLIAVAFGWRGMITHNIKIQWTSLGILLLTAAWILVAWLVVTPRERLIHANQAIVAAATHRNVAGMMRYIAPQAMFGTLNRPQIEALITDRLRQANLSSNDIRYLGIQRRGRYAHVRLNVLSYSHEYGTPVLTYWRLSWRDHKKPGNWQITHIRLLQINHHSVSSNELIPRP